MRPERKLPRRARRRATPRQGGPPTLPHTFGNDPADQDGAKGVRRGAPHTPPHFFFDRWGNKGKTRRAKACERGAKGLPPHFPTLSRVVPAPQPAAPTLPHTFSKRSVCRRARLFRPRGAAAAQAQGEASPFLGHLGGLSRRSLRTAHLLAENHPTSLRQNPFL